MKVNSLFAVFSLANSNLDGFDHVQYVGVAHMF